MQNFFLLAMNVLFGKKWVFFDLKQGYKATLFMNEVETDMIKENRVQLVKAQDSLKQELAAHEAKTISDQDIIDQLPVDQKSDKKAAYELGKKLRGAHAEQISVLKNRITSTGTDIEKTDAELAKAYSITYKNRVKYEFLKNYQIK